MAIAWKIVGTLCFLTGILSLWAKGEVDATFILCGISCNILAKMHEKD